MIIDKSVIDKAVKLMRSGGIISFPTETVYALATNISNMEAISRLYSIKERNNSKPFAILVDSIAMIERVAILDSRVNILLKEYAPGPLTIVVNLKKNIKFPTVIRGSGNTIGVRIPKHKLALEIIKLVGEPIIATSANISNYTSSTTAEEVDAVFGSKIDMIIDGGKSEIGIGSTVVDLSSNKIKLLREGSISFEAILRTLN